MPNHFHLVGKIKSEEDILANLGFVNGLTSSQIEKKISKCFSNLFSSYTQSFNKLYQRMGSLFIPNMKRKLIEEDAAFCSVVHYVHANPVQARAGSVRSRR